jgi:hypothetical protein
MKRTTVSLDEALHRLLKQRVAEQGTTLQAVVADLLRRSLAAPKPTAPYRLKLQGWEAQEQAGVDLPDRDKLFDLIDGR